jgi:DamX protein
MAENDTFSYHEKNPWLKHENTSFNVLISQERTRKLELINHLLVNSEQALVVCGLENLDKSNFLNDLKQNKLDACLYCQIQAKANLTFDKIQDQAVKSINLDKKNSKNTRGLSNGFSVYERQHKKLILIIDDAGYLDPSLMNTIINHVTKTPFLRVIFILTHDELDNKNNTEPALFDCCLIEIDSHSEQNSNNCILDRIELASESHETITENHYLESQIDLGQILYKIPAKEDVRKNDHSLKILVFAVFGLIIMALITQWYSASKYNLKDNLDTTATDNSSQHAQPIVK